jgi:PKD repeat protein
MKRISGPRSTAVAGARTVGRRREALRLVLLLGLVAAIALAGTTGWSAPASATPTSAPSAGPGASPDRGTSSPNANVRDLASANCSALTNGWALLDGGRPAPAVRASLETPCTLDPDVAGLYFLSNATGSGDRTEFEITLPVNGTGSAREYSAFWLGMWVTGIGCSYAGASYLTVELIPPFAAGAGVGGVPYWTVEAPAWDLVPAGSCDPQCQNDTTFFTIAGRGYCEDDAVVVGFGALSAGGHGTFEPGDLLTLTLDGAAGGTAPLAVYLNDSTDSARSLTWNYAANATVNGTRVNQTVTDAPLVPLYSNATERNGGWTGGRNIGFGWYGCPEPTDGDSFGAACDSYAGGTPLLGAPELDAVTSWNASAHAYSNPYPEVETVSSTGACAGAAGMPSCADFTTYGGAGVYPVFGLASGQGHAWYTFAANGTSSFRPFGSVASEFLANGTLSPAIDPTVVGPPSISVGTGSATVSFRATDPVGTARAWVVTWWCTSHVNATETTYAALLSGSPGNTFEDGNWTAATSTSTYTGSFFYWTRALSFDGVWTTSPIFNVTIQTGSSGSCLGQTPPHPGFTASDIAPVGGGYSLNWTGNFTDGTTSYRVVATPVKGGSPTQFNVGNASSARLMGLTGNASYDLVVVALDPLGFANPSPSVPGPATLYALAYRLVNETDSSPWAGSAVLRVSANVTGGLPPFEFEFSFGDGTSETVWTTSGAASAVHAFAVGYCGIAVIALTVDDTAGDAVTPPPLYLPVQGPPTAVPATMVGGFHLVHLRWTPPTSPGTVTSYQVLWTTDPAWAPYLTIASLENASLPGLGMWHVNATTRTYGISVSDGTEVYALVVAWNAYGMGLLPSGAELGAPVYLTAIASPFVGTMTSTVSGGPAPLADAFNATFMLQPGDALENATYHFTPGGSVPATIAGVNGTYFANVSTVFDRPGLVDVDLYVTDTLSQSTILFTNVYVSAGPTPFVTIAPPSPPVWVNTSFALTANASGGSGSYSYAWGLGDGGTATGNPVNYSYVAAGTYLVSVVVNDTVWGGSETASVPVTVFAPQTVQIAETSTVTYGTYQFTAIPHGGYGNLTYTWLFDDGSTAKGATASHAWATSGNYTVTLQAKDGYGHTATTSAAIEIPPLPSPSGGSGGSNVSATLVGALVILVLALAVVAVFFAVRGRRRGPKEPEGAAAVPAEENPAEENPAGEPWPVVERGPTPEEEQPSVYR